MTIGIVNLMSMPSETETRLDLAIARERERKAKIQSGSDRFFWIALVVFAAIAVTWLLTGIDITAQ